MACIQHIYISIFFLAIITSHHILFAEGRQLKALKKQEFDSTHNPREKENHGSQVINSKQNSATDFNSKRKSKNSSISGPKGSLDDLKDHSPGIGHSFRNENIGVNIFRLHCLVITKGNCS